MNQVALSGSDSVTINNRIFSGFGTGEYGTLSFPNKIANVKTGKNNNSIYAYNATGQNFEFVLKLIRGCADDIYLNGLLAGQQSNFAGTVLMIGEFVKQIGDGQGNVTNDTYLISGMVFDENVGAKSSAEGDTEQSEVVYHFRGSVAQRVLT